MKNKTILLAGVALAISVPTVGQAQSAPAPAAADNAVSSDIIVTARKRQETLLDVPVAVTGISGDTLAQRNIGSVKDAALLSPGLNINGDGAGRAFIAIRGVGVTLVSSVQPGVGLFIDGIYQPNTSYLNNPLVDVERVEVLRGPQGTLYGKNTLGGAINIISRVPTNELQGRASVSYAGPDDAWTAAGSISGAIIPDKIQARIGYAHREQKGFLYNSVIGGRANPLNTDSVNAMLRFLPGDNDVVLTVKGYYDSVDGVNTPYARVTGPTDYSRLVPFNALNRVQYKYRGVNAKLEAPIEALNSTVTLIGAYDTRSGNAPDNDADFGPLDLVRTNSRDNLYTGTVEARLDSKWSDSLSSLFGLFYSREVVKSDTIQTLVFLSNFQRRTLQRNTGDTYAAFGTLFWKPSAAWEVALGMRYDHESRASNGSTGGVAAPEQTLKSNQLEPRLTITRHWTSDIMSYASVSRGYRGGGFNDIRATNRVYQGDSAWTYEVGSRYMTRALSLSGSLFYNDYSHYIGLNSIAPLPGGGFVTVDLNSGHVESYGAELEATIRPTDHWTISGGATLMHARLTNSSEYTQTTGRLLSSNRLTFQPDWTFNVHTDYVVPVGSDSLTFSMGVSGKGKRLAATLNQVTPTFLDPYYLTDASITYRTGPFEIAVFGTNLFNEKYFDSYIEKTTLQLAGIPASDVGIIGDRGRYGVRASVKF